MGSIFGTGIGGKFMSEIYSSIMAGLREAVDDAKGEKKLRRTTYTIVPLKEYDPEEIK
jgi:putative transcriptional regulator